MDLSKKRSGIFLWNTLLLILTLIACQPQTVETVQEVVVTRVVTETVVEEGEVVEVTQVATEVHEVMVTPVVVEVVTTEAPLPTATLSSVPQDVGTGGQPTVTPDFGSIAYDVPKHMIQDEEVQVILLVSPSEDDNLVMKLGEELEEVEQQPGNVVTATIKMAKRMSATLTGVPTSAFEIVPIQAHDEQRIYDDKPTQWEWTVLPKEGGTHRLILHIDRLVEMEGIVEHLQEEVYRDDVTVEVTLSRRIKDFSASLFNVNGLVGLIVVSLLTVLFTRWLNKRGSD